MKTPDQREVESRLRSWGQWVQDPPELTAWPSVFGKISEMHDNAGARGEGIIYEIIDGTACPPDGGMAAAYERSAKRSTWDIKCRDVHRAINNLPKKRREIIRAMYIVSHREDPRGITTVSEMLGIDKSNAQKSLDLAREYIGSQIMDRFVLIDTVPQTKAA